MFCTKCGSKQNDNVNFCTSCGNAMQVKSNSPQPIIGQPLNTAVNQSIKTKSSGVSKLKIPIIILVFILSIFLLFPLFGVYGIIVCLFGLFAFIIISKQTDKKKKKRAIFLALGIPAFVVFCCVAVYLGMVVVDLVGSGSSGKGVELTMSNIKEYISFDVNVSDYVERSSSFTNPSTAKVTVTSRSLQNVSYKNATVKVRCSYNQEWGDVELTINISYNGSGSSSAVIEHYGIMWDSSFPQRTGFEIISVK